MTDALTERDLDNVVLSSPNSSAESHAGEPAKSQDHVNIEFVPSPSQCSKRRLARYIHDELGKRSVDDPILGCGNAALGILVEHHATVLELAHEKLHAWSFRDVPMCWRRLYEDASLYKAASIMLEDHSSSDNHPRPSKKRRLEACCEPSNPASDRLSRIVEALDMGIALSGQPYRKDLFRSIFDALDDTISTSADSLNNAAFTIETPKQPDTVKGVTNIHDLDFDDFQKHLDNDNGPLVITGMLDEWPCIRLWNNPGYLLQRTIGGRRLVPVEIGQSYTDGDWSQRIMTFKDYMQEFVLPEMPERVGYLAQHDLLSQIPALLKDVRIPDYCYTNPPPAPSTIPQRPLQLDEPQLNAWFGPKGTRSPLHTDPYYNVLCQIVGFKYVRLYSPVESSKLYPRGRDEAGINMANTSQVEMSFARGHLKGETAFPLFERAEYQDVILGAGECLYIPAGWWHFVESLTTSFSVSYWWN